MTSLVSFPLQIPVLVPMAVDTGVLAIFVSGGAIGMLLAGVSAFRAIRAGTRADEQDDLAQAERSARRATRAKEHAEQVVDYWHRYAGALEYELSKRGGGEAVNQVHELMGDPPEPPEEEPMPRGSKPPSASSIYSELKKGIPGLGSGE